MKSPPGCFALPHDPEPDFARVFAYWRGLLRGAADMPFWDDYDPGALRDLAGRLVLLDVFDKPQRFRFNTVGGDLASDKAGGFVDTADSPSPFDYLEAQASATMEGGCPTFFRHPFEGDSPKRTYSRLLLPMWGDGRVGMILGFVDLG